MSTSGLTAVGERGMPSPWVAWYTVGVLTVMYCVAFLDRMIMSLMVAPIRADLAISDFQLSLLHGLGFALFYAIFGLPIGYLVDRASRRRLIYVGMTIWSAATAVCGLTQTYFQLLLARMTVGAGEATLNPSSYSIISDTFSKRGVTVALSVYACGSSVGAAISIAVIGSLIAATAHMTTIAVPLIGDLAPWRVIFLLVGVPGIFIALLSFTMPEPARRGRMSQEQPPLSAGWEFLKSRRTLFICHFMGFSLIQLASYAAFTWLPTYMMRHYQWTVAEVAPVIGLTTLASVPQMMLIGWFVERRFQAGQTDIHLTSYAVIALVSAVLIIAAVAVQIAWLAAVLFAIGLGMLAYIGVASAAMQIVTPNEFRGQISVTFMFIMTLIGYGIGPSLPAAFTDFLFQDDKMVGWSMALSLAVTAPIASAFLWCGRGAMRRAVEDAKAWTGS